MPLNPSNRSLSTCVSFPVKNTGTSTLMYAHAPRSQKHPIFPPPLCTFIGTSPDMCFRHTGKEPLTPGHQLTTGFSVVAQMEKQAFGSKMLKAILGLSFWDLFVVDPWKGVLTSSQMDIQQ